MNYLLATAFQMHTAFQMLYTIVIGSGQVSQPPDARGNEYPCTS